VARGEVGPGLLQCEKVMLQITVPSSRERYSSSTGQVCPTELSDERKGRRMLRKGHCS